MSSARALPTIAVEKVWGRDKLPQPFKAPQDERIGEIWFEPPPELPEILVKYLFTSENLSVQVHPRDDQSTGGAGSKEECWLVLSAEPGARLAVGFAGSVTREAMRTAALDGSIEGLLEWHAVTPGDFIYLPAGTVHAIGAGISLIEVQQNTDITYRLYDYGRPRELHLDAAIAVADGGPHPAHLRRHLPERGPAALVDGPHFRLDRVDGEPEPDTAARYGDRPVLVIPIDAPVAVGGIAIAPGGCGYAGSLAEAAFAPGGLALIAQPA